MAVEGVRICMTESCCLNLHHIYSQHGGFLTRTLLCRTPYTSELQTEVSFHFER